MNFKQFWSEWGISKNDAAIILGASGVFAVPIVLYVFLSLFV